MADKGISSITQKSELSAGNNSSFFSLNFRAKARLTSVWKLIVPKVASFIQFCRRGISADVGLSSSYVGPDLSPTS